MILLFRRPPYESRPCYILQAVLLNFDPILYVRFDSIIRSIVSYSFVLPSKNYFNNKGVGSSQKYLHLWKHKCKMSEHEMPCWEDNLRSAGGRTRPAAPHLTSGAHKHGPWLDGVYEIFRTPVVYSQMKGQVYYRKDIRSKPERSQRIFPIQKLLLISGFLGWRWYSARKYQYSKRHICRCSAIIDSSFCLCTI
jgi:hypothetical protein